MGGGRGGAHFKTYYRAMKAEAVWLQSNKRHTNQWGGTESPGVGSYTQDQLMLDKSAHTVQAVWLASSTRYAGKADTQMQEMETQFLSFILDKYSAHDRPKTKCKIPTGNMHGDMSARVTTIIDAGLGNYFLLLKQRKQTQRQTNDDSEVLYSTRTMEEKTSYRMREPFTNSPPDGGFISIIHSVFTICKGFKKQDSDYKMSNCFEQSQIHEARSISSVIRETETTTKYHVCS